MWYPVKPSLNECNISFPKYSSCIWMQPCHVGRNVSNVIVIAGALNL